MSVLLVFGLIIGAVFAIAFVSSRRFGPLALALAAGAVLADIWSEWLAIIIGGFVFGLACLFSLGEVIHWVEETRSSRAPGRQSYAVGYWRPVLHVLGTVVLGVGGFMLMRTWCS